jgi:TPR repeat protein/tRNA A-37 threonylcarbamoyl transferase component Bud32/type II secretory pathway pseudopilin PulG
LELSGAEAEVVTAEKPGDKIGHYKLLQKIGEGGMGTVWMAEQEEPIRRRVALKIIKLGMDTKQVIARFEAERQALALMDHPNIAKVLDAGATDTGRPYFVMELVSGLRATDYCDQHSLSTRARLELFIKICQAVQHAHQKGIIHRDLKPSNILITELDGAAVPKIIDFGIAKATNTQGLTDKTLLTVRQQFLGTPAYMSPEQAGMSGVDTDTRCDIYALGVLLYELLTGHLPFERKELLAAGFEEMCRLIREQEPVKPSTRLNALAAADLTTVAKRQQTEPPRLVHLVRGDLDWIIMKCLEKDRSRRYDTVSGLANDIGRHLTGEPVTAGAPGVTYRAGKFIRRHRFGFVTTCAIILLLIAGVVVSTSQAVRATRAEKQANAARTEADKQRDQARQAQAEEARQRKTAEEAKAETVLQLKLTQQEKEKAQQAEQKASTVSTFLEDMLQGVTPEQAKGRDTKLMLELLDKATARVDQELKDQPLLQAKMQDTLGNVYCKLRQYPKAEPLLRGALETRERILGKEDTNTLTSMTDLAGLLFDKGDYAGAELLCRRVVETQERILGKENPVTLSSLSHLAVVLWQKGDRAEAEPLARQVLATQERTMGKEYPDTLKSELGLSGLLLDKGDYGAAESLIRHVVEVRQRTLGKEHPDTLNAMNDLGVLLLVLKKDYAAAETLFRQLLETQEHILGKEHPDTLNAMHNLASVLLEKGDYVAAEPLMRYVLDVRKRILGEEHPDTLKAMNNLANLLLCMNDTNAVEAVNLYRKAAEQNLAVAQCKLGSCYWAGQGVATNYSEAVKWFRKAADQDYAEAQGNLGVCYLNGLGVPKNVAEAVRWLRKSAEQNDANGEYALAACFFLGQGVAKDQAEAVKWYRKAADQDNAEAQNTLGFCYWAGQGVATNYPEAVKWYRKAAEQNNAQAQFNLGVCYDKGDGVAQDEAEAVKWYRKAAEQNNIEGQRNLGTCYVLGHGVVKDVPEGLGWVRKAAARNDGPAQCILGLCYSSGEIMAKDYVEAYKWLLLAADQGLAPAKKQLILLEKEMTPGAIDEGRRRASVFTSSPASALPVIVHASESNSVNIISITPALPAQLHLGERMSLKIRYSCQTRTVHFWVWAHKKDGEPVNVFNNGQPYFSPATGRGETDYCQFGSTHQADVDEVEVIMVDADTSIELARASMTIEAHWK